MFLNLDVFLEFQIYEIVWQDIKTNKRFVNYWRWYADEGVWVKEMQAKEVQMKEELKQFVLTVSFAF